jgi:hypothetical protein
MQQWWFDVGSAVFAAASAVFWMLSARVDFPFGFDMDLELRDAAKRSAKLNSIAAALAAVAAILPAAKVLAMGLGWA